MGNGVSYIGAKDQEIQNRSIPENITDVYICVFFDGTSNNMFEQIHKMKTWMDKTPDFLKTPKTLFSLEPDLFGTNLITNKMDSDRIEMERYGMKEFEQQRSQADSSFEINQNRTEGNGGWKYSNVAILRSLVEKNGEQVNSSVNGNNVIGVNYSLYIEGAGSKWDGGSDVIGAGMGTGRTGVVGLVSKAMVFVTEYLNAGIPEDRRSIVKVHFAVFGFSRGSTCSRLFSYLVADDPNALPKSKEFFQYLPDSKSYRKNGKLIFLDEFKQKTVDFLGIYDTVTAIGFLMKDNNLADTTINKFNAYPTTTNQNSTNETKFVNRLHGKSLFGDANGTFHRYNAKEYGQYSPQREKVKHTFHICAMDEYRENFALMDLGTKLEHCTEIFMPGCHSDIGGGYMYGDDIERFTLRKKICGRDTRIVDDPQNLDPRKQQALRDLSQDVLYDVGWIDRKTNKKSEKFKLPNGKQSVDTPEQTTYIHETEEKIEFERFVKEGYSNITLEMMKHRVQSKNGLKELWPAEFVPFQKPIPTRFTINTDAILDSVKNEAIKDYEEGARYWVIPSREDYISLRRKYIHFTSTDELNIEKLHFKQSGANIGNPPNWRDLGSYFLLSRIVYRGDENDSTLHYMNEYK